ncbi:MAG: ATP-binding cassette domain-containing protein [Melioribacteraceae bacterium]|nr:ATP-binding cassette domain-containing protein [Melioribacteraceae bacterium]MCF8355190.1 ATP-binding cassette domain-containing protein [Melioribacteraceae bacterium]MCF8395403.1 ATP-binding cassette domain-containing protein [Melioribacteraceae bacterium]MCF8419891.1 ATP-binding cassette domain-containing protein [Melioribacteraceae bacterium]
MEDILQVKDLSRIYTDEVGFKIKLFNKINFTVEQEKITSIIAPKGAGKSSLMKIISGLDHPTEGEINFKQKGNVIFIPSKPSSFPWYNVTENIKITSNEIDDTRLTEIINSVGLEGYEDHMPDNRSLGFRFRISLARALALNPVLIVLDEPFTEMDPVTKEEIYNLLLSIPSKEKTTILMATTNISEAILLSEKIYLMKKSPGEIIDSIDIEFYEEVDLKLMDSQKYVELRRTIEEKFKHHHSQKLFNFSI